MKILIALMASAATPAIVMFVVGLLYGAPGEAYFYLRGVLVISGLMALLLGLPVHLILKYNGARKLKVYSVVGAFIGAILGMLVFLPDVVNNWQTAHEHSIKLLISGFPIVTAIAGCLASSVFWSIAVRRA